MHKFELVMVDAKYGHRSARKILTTCYIHPTHYLIGGLDQESDRLPSEPTYADPVLLAPATNPNPPAADEVLYQGLRGFQSSQDLVSRY